MDQARGSTLQPRTLHAGYVKTDINKGGGEISVEESVKGILQGEAPPARGRRAASMQASGVRIGAHQLSHE